MLSLMQYSLNMHLWEKAGRYADNKKSEQTAKCSKQKLMFAFCDDTKETTVMFWDVRKPQTQL